MAYGYAAPYSFGYDEFTPPLIDDGGVYMREDGRIDESPTCGEHPRVTGPGQKYPGPMGAGREHFRGGYDSRNGDYAEHFNRAGWQRGCNEREERAGYDAVDWDPRPPHYNPCGHVSQVPGFPRCEDRYRDQSGQHGTDHTHLSIYPEQKSFPQVNPYITRSQAIQRGRTDL